MTDISKITLPSGNSYNIKDAQARSDIATLRQNVTGAMHFIGTTSTAISDGSSIDTIYIGETPVTPDPGDVVIYGATGEGTSAAPKEYVWNGTHWEEFGSTGSLKAMAFADSASMTYTPGGSVSQPAFTGTAGKATVTYTPGGSIAISTSVDGTANYTPAGSVSTPTITVTPTTTAVNSITNVGTLPECTLPTLETSVFNETLTISWTQGTFSAGTLPTKGADQNVMTQVTATAAKPTFSGTATHIGADFTGEQVVLKSDYTPSGVVAQPTFTGSQATITVTPDSV